MSLDAAMKKLQEIEARYEDLAHEMLAPDVTSDISRYTLISKQWSDLESIVVAFRDYKTMEQAIRDSEAMLSDPEMHDLAMAEIDDSRARILVLEEHIRLLLLPKDPNDDRDVIVEIRPAAGGSEAALFAGELFRMYSRYAERRGWKQEVLEAQETGIGGYDDVVLSIKATGAYSQLKFESGVHRVQRVPATEASGRIHTSTVTVAVLPETEDVQIEVSAMDIEMDVYHSSSAGGQNVQKVATAIRIHHKPTGLVVTCQDERSQLQNKEKAMRMLRLRLYERELMARTAERTEARRSQVGTGDRSEKIRTYNYPDGRVTDHRIGLTIHNVPGVLDGGIQPFVEGLVTADQAEKLRAQSDTP